RQATGDQGLREVGREQPWTRCRRKEARLVELEGGDRGRQGIERREYVVDRVEDRGLVLLELSVVALGQALERREEGDQISDDRAGLPAGQFGDIRIPLLRHQTAA